MGLEILVHSLKKWQRQRKLRNLAKGQRINFIQTPKLNSELQRFSLENETQAERHHSDTDAEHVEKIFLRTNVV